MCVPAFLLNSSSARREPAFYSPSADPGSPPREWGWRSPSLREPPHPMFDLIKHRLVFLRLRTVGAL